MAWAEKQRSGRWAGRYRDANGDAKGLGKTFTRKAEAEREAAVAEDKARSDPTRVDPRAGRLTWAAWEPEWQTRRRVEPGTAAREPSRVNRVRDRWGNVALAAIRRDDVQAWVNELADSGMSAWSVHHHYRLLSSSLKDATIEKRIVASPCVGIRLPALVQGDRRFFTHDEFSRISACMSGRYHPLVNLLVGTGLRWAEAVGLHQHRVDLAREELEVVEVFDDKLGEVKPYPKGRARRVVPLPDWLTPMLREHLASLDQAGDCGVEHRHGSRCRSGLLIPSRAGTPISYSGFRTRHWSRAIGGPVWRLRDGREYGTRSDAARVKRGAGPPVRVWRDGLAEVGEGRIHDLRHTYAAWNLTGEFALSLYELSVVLGHSSIRVTEQYAHLLETSRQRNRRAMAWPTSEPAQGSAGHEGKDEGVDEPETGP